MKTETFNLPHLKIEAAANVASKALDFPAFPLSPIEGTKNFRPETRIPCKELMILTDAALLSIRLNETRDELIAALKSAHEVIAKCGGASLGITMSGKDHPNPDEVLTDLFQLCNEEALKISALVERVKPSES